MNITLANVENNPIIKKIFGIKDLNNYQVVI